MRALIRQLDDLLAKIIEHTCTLLMLMLTLLVLYAVLMRYVFLAPLFWGDVTAVLINTALVLLGVTIAVRNRELVAMQALYEILPRRAAHALEALWNLLILVFAILFAWYGYRAAQTISGQFWELGMLPRSYPMMIMPVAGTLLAFASLRILAQDWGRLRSPNVDAASTEEISDERK